MNIEEYVGKYEKECHFYYKNLETKYSAFLYACYFESDIKIINNIVEQFNINVEFKNIYSFTGFQLACYYNEQFDAVRNLIENLKVNVYELLFVNGYNCHNLKKYNYIVYFKKQIFNIDKICYVYINKIQGKIMKKIKLINLL